MSSTCSTCGVLCPIWRNETYISPMYFTQEQLSLVFHVLQITYRKLKKEMQTRYNYPACTNLQSTKTQLQNNKLHFTMSVAIKLSINLSLPQSINLIQLFMSQASVVTNEFSQFLHAHTCNASSKHLNNTAYKSRKIKHFWTADEQNSIDCIPTRYLHFKIPSSSTGALCSFHETHTSTWLEDSFHGLVLVSHFWLTDEFSLESSIQIFVRPYYGHPKDLKKTFFNS